MTSTACAARRDRTSHLDPRTMAFAAFYDSQLAPTALWRDEAVRDGGRFEPVRRVELAQDVRDVDAGGLDADHELGGDLAVGVAAGDERQHLRLARRQPEALLRGPASRGVVRRRRRRDRAARVAASSSSSRSRGCAPIRAATACASLSGALASARGRAGGDERLGLAPAAVGRERRAFELSQVAAASDQTRAGRRRAARSYSASASAEPAVGVRRDAEASAAARRAAASSSRARPSRRGRRRVAAGAGERRQLRLRAQPLGAQLDADLGGLARARPRQAVTRRPRRRPSSGAPRGRARRGSVVEAEHAVLAQGGAAASRCARAASNSPRPISSVGADMSSM